MSERLEAGCRYVAIGPAPGSKLGPPQEVEILEVDETAGRYRTKGTRQVSNFIVFGAEHMWRRVEAETPAELVPPWWEGRLVAFDVETTGVDPEEARIVTAAIALCGGGEPTETRTWLIDPGCEIPEEAAAVHGITTERARAEGQDPAEAIGEILEVLACRPAGAPIVAFNARFDLTILDREARRHGYVPLQEQTPITVIDPLVCDKWLHRYRKGSRKLDAQAAHYGARLDAAHDAADDAIAAARVAWCIGKRGEVIRRVRDGREAIELRNLQAEWEQARHDFGLLHAAQERWAHDQAASLEDYFRQQGKPELVERAWPVIPVREPMAAAA